MGARGLDAKMVLKHILENEKRNPNPALLLQAIGNFSKRTIIESLAHNETDIATLQQILP
jgi:hypothetical protein